MITATASTLAPQEQATLILCFLKALLKRNSKESVGGKLLRELAEEKHNLEKHPQAFNNCVNLPCSEVNKHLINVCSEEAVFVRAELDEVNSYDLRYGQPIVGKLRIWLEKRSSILKL